MTRKTFALLFAGLPLPALASGSDVFLSLWSELALFVAVLVSLVVTRIALRAKLLVLAVYLAAAVLAHWATWTLPYRDNQALILSVSLVVPGVCWLVALVFAHQRAGSAGRPDVR